MPKISPFLWFDSQAEEAAKFYVSLFANSRITHVQRYGKDAMGEEGKVMVVAFEIDGQKVTALNGGPHFKLSEAFSFVVDCEDQKEVDFYWDKLTADGGEPSQCGWLKDKFGLSWQIVPKVLLSILGDPDREKSARATQAMLKMKKLDIGALERARDGL